MTQSTAILIGSMIYLAIGAGAAAFFFVYVGNKTKNPHEVGENRQIAMVSVAIGTFCLWLMWVVAYMAQLNPLISPEYLKE